MYYNEAIIFFPRNLLDTDLNKRIDAFLHVEKSISVIKPKQCRNEKRINAKNCAQYNIKDEKFVLILFTAQLKYTITGSLLCQFFFRQ